MMTDIPEGWKLVPAKHDGKAGLTAEMFDAFWVAFMMTLVYRGHFESVNAGYNAMLAAAPQYKEKGCELCGAGPLLACARPGCPGVQW